MYYHFYHVVYEISEPIWIFFLHEWSVLVNLPQFTFPLHDSVWVNCDRYNASLHVNK